ncbi:DODA-type extradiol aromatic ring-opening family dioxygenase [Candidatus Marinarcus aquaticus]|uniref:Dioxygenase n=1 Tax=Candidatus Marinarcus aquaticus TaxID=2044504 RepID=A0A4V1LP32_9BACT|nr:class III extradiol ring-cleavage dioxygenase [Candidatus Marinarcus aquaticus]RXJ58110.1 dioxygenase [Candidatus Marinarcus aquaticus]
MFPTLFISHGAPNTILKAGETKKNLRSFASTLDKPKYIVVISSHWVSSCIEMIYPKTNTLMYDFYGFEKELYEFTYDIASDEATSKHLLNRLEALNIQVNPLRQSFDHGVWTALSMMYETLDIPVIQLSLPAYFSAQEYFEFGEALKVLKDEALLVFSGSITHNLYDIDPTNSHTPKYATLFNEQIKEALEMGEYKKILEYEKLPYFKKNHHTSEHFTPLLIALGASQNQKATSFNSEFVYGNISMESYSFQ